MLTRVFLYLAEKSLIPFPVLKFAVWCVVYLRFRELAQIEPPINEFLNLIKKSPIALVPEKANEQHYELPPEFYLFSLGSRRKYSSCLYNSNQTTLDEAELSMLELYCERAELKDGMDILELGCGWGSLTLFLAERYPNSKITGVSNSENQRKYILSFKKSNVEIITCDINNFSTNKKFDRIISIEMFEHLRNWELLFNNISSWLKDGGVLFFHIFCHKSHPYIYQTEGNLNWMGRYFFTGGMMPSESLPLYINSPLRFDKCWRVNGLHYAKTARDWRLNLERNKSEVIKICKSIYGDGLTWYSRWRLFYLACEVLFGFSKGNEWFVAHYRFKK